MHTKERTLILPKMEQSAKITSSQPYITILNINVPEHITYLTTDTHLTFLKAIDIGNSAGEVEYYNLPPIDQRGIISMENSTYHTALHAYSMTQSYMSTSYLLNVSNDQLATVKVSYIPNESDPTKALILTIDYTDLNSNS